MPRWNCTLEKFPVELLSEIFSFVPSQEACTIRLVCRTFDAACDQALWRAWCQQTYEHWSPEHRFASAINGEIVNFDWKALYVRRSRLDRSVSASLSSILNGQQNRLRKQHAVISHGIDVKDTLLRHLKADAACEDVLARRWYSQSILESLYRSCAVETWIQLRLGTVDSLEEALAAFDVFVAKPGYHDHVNVASELDRIAASFRSSIHIPNDRCIRSASIALVAFLRKRDLMGIRDDIDQKYHDLRNSFLNLTLSAHEHASLPLISVAIYCCVARRLGLNASPCGFPFHMLAIVESPQGCTLDGADAPANDGKEVMYLDPFRSSDEVSLEELEKQLRSMGIPNEEFGPYLLPISASEIVARCARNIVTSVQSTPRDTATLSDHPNTKHAFYAAVWALVLLPASPDRRLSALQQNHYIPVLLRLIEQQFPADISLLEKHIIPALRDDEQAQQASKVLQSVRANDENTRVVKRRSDSTRRSIPFRIGQVFQHKRYHYQAIITGWDTECTAPDQWMTQMRIHDLKQGRHQNFYHVLVQDRSTRYVAEENIGAVGSIVDKHLMGIAGQYFRRWDPITHDFVSNIKDEYPDD